MGKRIDILDSLYAHLVTISEDTYAPLKSEGNGSISFFDLVNDACAHFSIQPEESSQAQGQADYFVSAPLYLTAYKRYTLPVDPNENDVTRLALNTLMKKGNSDKIFPREIPSF